MTWRPKRFRLGAMRERIQLQSATTDASSGEPNRTWSATLSDEPASFEQVSGNETLRGRQVDASVTTVFVVHYRENTYSTEQRIVHNGTNYGIVRVNPVEGGKRYLEIDCRASGVATVD